MRGPKKPRFDTIFKEGKRAAGRYCRLTALPGTGLVGIATSRKIGNAPQRNRARRRFREGLRSLRESIDPGLDYVVLVHPDAVLAGCGEIRGELEKLLSVVNRRWAEGSESS